jgi:dipeptidyl aminopeptidase/acylaminoacyl peptidase
LSPTRTLPPEPSLTPTDAPPTFTPTPVDPYQPYTIDALTQRKYGSGTLEIVETIAENSYFTRYLFKYPSDGLTIYGFLNIPVGDGPFPVVIAVHGWVDPVIYNTLDYTTHYADELARQGFFVLHPNLRGYPPSDMGDNTYRVGMAVDVLNLLALVRAEAGKTAPLQQASVERVGLWGHSMGGGVITRVMVVDPTVDAVVLYGAISGNTRQTWEWLAWWSSGEMGAFELAATPEMLVRISPDAHYDRVASAVSIHHGRNDEVLPLRWARETCEQLTALGKTVECFYYKNQPHTFDGEADVLFMQRVTRFFRTYLLEKDV